MRREAVMNAVARLLLSTPPLVSGCAGHREPLTPSTGSSADLAGVDWSRAGAGRRDARRFQLHAGSPPIRARPALRTAPRRRRTQFRRAGVLRCRGAAERGQLGRDPRQRRQSRDLRRQGRHILLRAASGGHLSAGVLASPAFALRHDRRDRNCIFLY